MERRARCVLFAAFSFFLLFRRTSSFVSSTLLKRCFVDRYRSVVCFRSCVWYSSYSESIVGFAVSNAVSWNVRLLVFGRLSGYGRFGDGSIESRGELSFEKTATLGSRRSRNRSAFIKDARQNPTYSLLLTRCCTRQRESCSSLSCSIGAHIVGHTGVVVFVTLECFF